MPDGAGGLIPEGRVVEQYAWEPYGAVAACDRPAGAIVNRVGHQGLFWDGLTGTFVTTNVRLIDLWIDGLDKPIGATASHPFWSLDRKGWVAAGDLKPGETLHTQEGSATVRSVVPRLETETVYNIEVHRDHTYDVSDAKLWAHNACTTYCNIREWPD